MAEYQDLLANANPKQITAIKRPSHCIVKAGPGTGKTRTLVLKAAYLLYNEIYPPRGLACITFTKDMANKLEIDLRELDLDTNPRIFIGTTHAFCLVNILLPFAKMYGFKMPEKILVPTGGKQVEIYQNIWREGRYRIPNYHLTKNDIKKERLPTKFQKYRRTQLYGFDSPAPIPIVEQLLHDYEEALINQGYLDFDLQEKWALKIVEAQPYVRQSIEAKFPWILVDEYQDMGLPLHRLVKALINDNEIDVKLFAIGDNNQCLYDFRGASPDYLNELCENHGLYGEPIELEQNYRFSKQVLHVSKLAMKSQNLWIDKEKAIEGRVEFVPNRGAEILHDIIERHNVPHDMQYSEIMILTHDWEKAKRIAEYVGNRLGIPCFKVDKDLYEHRKPLLDWLGKLMAYSLAGRSTTELRFNHLLPFWRLLLIANGFSKEEAVSYRSSQDLFDALANSFSSIDSGRDWLDFIDANIGLDEKLKNYTHLDDIAEFCKFKQALQPSNPLGTSSLENLQDRILVGNRVYVGTIHSRKGQESKTVILTNPEDFEWLPEGEKERLFYVGLTRAKEEIFINHNGSSELVNRLMDEFFQ